MTDEQRKIQVNHIGLVACPLCAGKGRHILDVFDGDKTTMCLYCGGAGEVLELSHAHKVASPKGGNMTDFQARVRTWVEAAFGEDVAEDKTERNHRFLEEALELVQTCGCTASEAHQLVDYVYSRPAGTLTEEVGGTMTTLMALCAAQGVSAEYCGEQELTCNWTRIDAIRAKQAAKPKHLPLPSSSEPPIK